MSADIIQARYDELDAIGSRFSRLAEIHATLIDQVNRRVEALQQGGWEGKAADAFFAEMESEIFPAMRRLNKALEEAHFVMREIKRIIQEAEEEAAAPFGTGFGEATGTTESVPGGEVFPGIASTPSTAVSVHSLFSNPYMDSFVGIKIRGEDSRRLNQAMKTLFNNPTGADLDRTLNELAEIRGVSPEELKTQYQRFLQLRDQAAAISRANGVDPPDPLSEFFHGDFMGSTAQLRYGKVVGDALGIDPILGALLNPTGGLVGPDNFAINPGDNDALGYHGIFHDAAGYLYNYHNLGPGYDYLGEESHRDPGNPLVGQQSGIRYWNEKLNPGLVTDVVHGVGDFVINTSETTINTIETGVEAFTEFGDRVGDFVGDAFEGAREVFEFVF